MRGGRCFVECVALVRCFIHRVVLHQFLVFLIAISIRWHTLWGFLLRAHAIRLVREGSNLGFLGIMLSRLVLPRENLISDQLVGGMTGPGFVQCMTLDMKLTLHSDQERSILKDRHRSTCHYPQYSDYPLVGRDGARQETSMPRILRSHRESRVVRVKRAPQVKSSSKIQLRGN